MTEYDIRRLALIFAVQAEIEGMKAANAAMLCQEYPPLYVEDHFAGKCAELENWAYCPDEKL